jgi:hypothetical protein
MKYALEILVGYLEKGQVVIHKENSIVNFEL